jgi:aspartokinase-like uncharacterized kinase
LLVAKVGGSLLDLLDLGPRLERWLATGGPARPGVPGIPAGRDVLLVPGGGATADVVRRLDACHGLGPERAHWLALGAMALNAHFLAALVSSWDRQPCLSAPKRTGRLPVPRVLDALAFARADEGRPGCLPHSWEVTSDAIAARVAVVAGAGELVLLKSVDVPEGIDWEEAGRRGLVDPAFAGVVRQAGPGLCVRAVNLRAWEP